MHVSHYVLRRCASFLLLGDVGVCEAGLKSALEISRSYHRLQIGVSCVCKCMLM